MCFEDEIVLSYLKVTFQRRVRVILGQLIQKNYKMLSEIKIGLSMSLLFKFSLDEMQILIKILFYIAIFSFVLTTLISDYMINCLEEKISLIYPLRNTYYCLNHKK